MEKYADWMLLNLMFFAFVLPLAEWGCLSPEPTRKKHSPSWVWSRFFATLHRTLWWCPLARQEHGRLHTALEDQVGGWRTCDRGGNWGDSNVVQGLPLLKHSSTLTNAYQKLKDIYPEGNGIDIHHFHLFIYIYIVFVHRYAFHLQQIDVYIRIYINNYTCFWTISLVSHQTSFGFRDTIWVSELVFFLAVYWIGADKRFE